MEWPTDGGASCFCAQRKRRLVGNALPTSGKEGGLPGVEEKRRRSSDAHILHVVVGPNARAPTPLDALRVFFLVLLFDFCYRTTASKPSCLEYDNDSTMYHADGDSRLWYDPSSSRASDNMSRFSRYMQCPLLLRLRVY